MEYMATIREKVDRALEVRRETIPDLARKLGVKSKQSLYDWLDEKRKPHRPDIWQRIADLLDIEVRDLLDPEVDNPRRLSQPKSKGHHLAELLMSVLEDPNADPRYKEAARYTLLEMLKDGG